MAEFFALALSLPTLLFTPLLGALFLYWALVILGIFDVDSLDSGHAEGALEGAMKGAGDAALEGVMKGAGDAALEGVMKGAGDAALEGVSKGSAEVLAGMHKGSEALAQAGMAANLLAFLGIGKVPVTIVLSVMVVVAWLTSFVGNFTLLKLGLVDGPLFWLSAAGVLLSACFVSMVTTSLVMRPFVKLFKPEAVRAQESLVGGTCKVTSARVDERSGRAEYSHKGVHLTLDVRYDGSSLILRDHEVLIVQYDRSKNCYLVRPLLEVEGTQGSQTPDSTSSRQAQAAQSVGSQAHKSGQ
jgi:hypothetical protein